MERIRFIRNTVPEREGGPGYKEGDVVELPRALCERWRRRDAAEYVVAEQAEVTAEELANGNAVDSPADVAQEDGGDPGERAEHDAPASQPRPRGRPAKHRG